MADLTDARGIVITAGDTVIYGFGVGRSIAMAEGVVVAEDEGYPYPAQTATGRIRIQIIRRSYSPGSKPVVDVLPDRLIVLKPSPYPELMAAYLPESSMPTQAEIVEGELRRSIERYQEGLDATEVPNWWKTGGHGNLANYHAFMSEMLADTHKKLRSLPCPDGTSSRSTGRSSGGSGRA